MTALDSVCLCRAIYYLKQTNKQIATPSIHWKVSMCQVFIHFIVLCICHNDQMNSLLQVLVRKAKSRKPSNLYNLNSMEELMLRNAFGYISIVIHGVIMICFTSGAHLWQVLFSFWEQRKNSLPWPLITCWGRMTSSGQWSMRENDAHHFKSEHTIPHHGAAGGCCMFAEIGWWHLNETLNDNMKQSLWLLSFGCSWAKHVLYCI